MVNYNTLDFLRLNTWNATAVVSSKPKIIPLKAEHRNNPIRDLADLKCQTLPSSLHILGISTTNTNPELPRVSELSGYNG
jgi:hypothetical protein